MIIPDKIQGHIILYCKGHYQDRTGKVDFITGLQRIWAVRCGLNLEHINKNMKEYIASELYRIILLTTPKKSEYMWEILHKGLVDEWNYKELSAIDRAIMTYYKEIMMLQVREISGNKRKTLIKLPRPQKQALKRIVRGNFKSGDYNLIMK